MAVVKLQAFGGAIPVSGDRALPDGFASESINTWLYSQELRGQRPPKDITAVASTTRKLLRSVAFKGVAAVVCEALAAARAADVEDWMRTELLTLLSAADDTSLRRMEDGSREHAVRRTREMADVAALLADLGVEAYMSNAARAQLEELARHG